MYILNTDTTIDIYPFINFPDSDVILKVIHKRSKTEVSLTQSYTSTNSSVSLNLPTMTDISNEADNLDELVVRVYDSSDTLFYEMVYHWVTDSPNILLSRKSWTYSADNDKEWITI